MFEKRDTERGQVGIGTLIVFIAMVLVAAIAAGVLINTAGFLQSSAEESGQQSGEQVTNRLQILQASGETTGNSVEIGKVELTATKGPGAEDIDLTGVTMQWVDDQGTFDLVHEIPFENNVDGAFATTQIKDEDDSLTDGTPVINDPDDRASIIIDIGNPDDLPEYTSGTADEAGDGEASNPNVAYGSNLNEGDTAQLRITTQSGTVSQVRLTVPNSLSGRTAANL